MNYNTSLGLWSAYASSNPSVALHVKGGHVFAEKGLSFECLARFDDDAHAIETLKAAGYVEHGLGCFRVASEVRKPLKLSGNMVTIPIDRATGECEVES